MVADKWLLLLEIPILWLLVRSIRARIARLNARIAEVKEAEARTPRDPYAALFDALDDAGGPASLPKSARREGAKPDRSAPTPTKLRNNGSSHR